MIYSTGFNAPLPSQVYFNQNQPRINQSVTNSYITMPSYGQSYMDNNSGKKNNRPTDRYENYYVSHNREVKETQEDHLLEGNLFIRKLNGSPTSLYGLCLFDSGSTSTLIDERAIPPNVAPKQGPTQLVITTQGNYSSSDYFDAHIPRSEWAFPTFIIPKKDGRVRWVNDFRRLNKLLKRPRYFLPSIPEIMQRRQGFTYISKIDISMGFYTFEIDASSQKFSVISTPFGLYKYKRLPMGITNSPDFFQSVMHPLFSDLPTV